MAKNCDDAELAHIATPEISTKQIHSSGNESCIHCAEETDIGVENASDPVSTVDTHQSIEAVTSDQVYIMEKVYTDSDVVGMGDS
jgi:hypothetical protein